MTTSQLRQNKSAGFSAIELLITLFVAAAFLVAGYQLFNAVINDGGETRAESQAGNEAYKYLRTYADSAENPCRDATPLVQSGITVEGLSNVTVSVNITCPMADAPSVSRVEAIINYNNPTKTVRHATLVDKSKGASPVPEITNGLISWWKLNGNGSTDVGDAHMTNNNAASATVGSNGQANGGMAFNRSFSQSLTVDNYTSRLVGLSAFSMTGWVYPQNTSATHQGFFGFRHNNVNSAYLLQLSGSTALECRISLNSTTYQQTSLTLTYNTWQLVALVYDGSSLRCYVNNTSNTIAAANWSTFNAGNLPMEIGSNALGNNLSGSVDDVRVYNRALSASEITQLVNGKGQ